MSLSLVIADSVPLIEIGLSNPPTLHPRILNAWEISQPMFSHNSSPYLSLLAGLDGVTTQLSAGRVHYRVHPNKLDTLVVQCRELRVNLIPPGFCLEDCPTLGGAKPVACRHGVVHYFHADLFDHEPELTPERAVRCYEALGEWQAPHRNQHIWRQTSPPGRPYGDWYLASDLYLSSVCDALRPTLSDIVRSP